MDIKLIIIIAFSYLYAIFEIFMGVMQRSKRTKDIVKKGDRASIWILFLFIGFGYYLAFRFGMSRMGRIYYWNTLFTIGALMVIAGMIIRIVSILTLKQHFTYTVTKIEGHELIETGFYKTIRHPGYLGQLIIFTGVAVSMSNWLSVICMFIPCFLGFIYRITVEERFMKEQMGQKYLDYQKRTKRLIPKIY